MDFPAWTEAVKQQAGSRRAPAAPTASDASAWIEFLAGSAAGRQIAGALPTRAEWLVPTMVQLAMVQLELAKWLSREAGEDRADQVIAFSTTCVVVDLDTALALSAADLAARHRLATADAIIDATARAHGADLLTRGRDFECLPGVRYVANPAT